jgi:hypothetical protein
MNFHKKIKKNAPINRGVLYFEKNYSFIKEISTLLFSAFPFAVLLDAIGLVSPKPVCFNLSSAFRFQLNNLQQRELYFQIKFGLVHYHHYHSDLQFGILSLDTLSRLQ